MKEVTIDSLRVSLTNQQRVLLLKEIDSERYFPIWIGPFEAEAIVIAVQGVKISRPQTHDLLIKTVHALGGKLRQVEIIALREDTFYADLVLESNGTEQRIDCRPSDAISLALRANVPILVHEDVLNKAGIFREEDIRKTNISEEGTEEPEDLSVFENFLEQIDPDADDHDSEGTDNPNDNNKNNPDDSPDDEPPATLV